MKGRVQQKRPKRGGVWPESDSRRLDKAAETVAQKKVGQTGSAVPGREWQGGKEKCLRETATFIFLFS